MQYFGSKLYKCIENLQTDTSSLSRKKFYMTNPNIPFNTKDQSI